MQLISTLQAAEILNMAPQSLRKMRLKGTGPSYHRLGGRYGKVGYLVEDIEAWLAKRKFNSTSEETVAAAKSKSAA